MGLIYAWSLFVEPIETEFGWERAQTSLIFTLSMISFSVGMVVAGIIEQRFSPRIIMVATAVIIAGGFIAAAQTTSLLWIYITYGIIVGFGVGVGTDCVMSVAVKWHPDKQGIASGGMLMGFGMGAMLLSPLVTVLLGQFSWQTTFLILGVVFGIVMLAVAFIVKLPPAEFVASMHVAKAADESGNQKRDYSALEMVKTRSFQLAFLWLILVSSGGLGLISQAVPAAEEVLSATGMDAAASAMMATAAMGGISLCNGFGRLMCGLVWDKFGYRISFLWVSVGFALSMLLCGVAIMLSSFPLIVAGFMLLGLVYGGNMATMAVVSSSFFGAEVLRHQLRRRHAADDRLGIGRAARARHAPNLHGIIRSGILGIFSRSGRSTCARVRHQIAARHGKARQPIIGIRASARYRTLASSEQPESIVLIMGGLNR